MEQLESYFEIEYSTINEPTYWRATGYRLKSFVEICNQVQKLIDKEKFSENKLVNTFRIVERRHYISIEEIKTFKLLV
jgi:hypothetical protein